MNNYVSIGCDALVTLNFHLSRDSLPISNRLFNKVSSSTVKNIANGIKIEIPID
jgi:hypothetical protein